MAVVSKYARSTKDPATFGLPLAVLASGRVRVISSGEVAIANGDSANSKLYLGKIPSHAVPLPAMSDLLHGAVTGVNDFDVGLEKDGVTTDIDIFADGLDIVLAGNKNPFAAVNTAALAGKTVWELLGLTSDPGVEYDVVATLKAAAAAAASVNATLAYAVK